jgi:hypothetical protein
MMKAMPGRSAAATPTALTRVKMRTAIARLQQRVRELQAFDPATVNARDEPRIGVLQRAIKQALIRSFGADTADYRRYAAAQCLDLAAPWSGCTPSLNEIRAGLRRGKQASLALLESLISRLQTSLQ